MVLRANGVVPLAMEGIRCKVEGMHLGIADHDLRWIVSPVGHTPHPQTRLRLCRADEMHDRRQRQQGTASPVLADEREQPMLNLVPFAGPRRQMTDMDRQPQWGDKQRDTLRSFLSVRKEMIYSMAPDLSREDIESLAGRTRGMRRDDIMRAVSEFKRGGKLPDPPAHPSNTCDPYTGNWAEHLMDPFSLRSILRREGFAAEALPGYWDPCQRPKWKAVMKSMTNMAISVLGEHGLCISPYYVLCGTKRQNRRLSEQNVSQQ